MLFRSAQVFPKKRPMGCFPSLSSYLYLPVSRPPAGRLPSDLPARTVPRGCSGLEGWDGREPRRARGPSPASQVLGRASTMSGIGRHRGRECPPAHGEPVHTAAHTSQRVVGIEPQSKVPEAGEELRFHLPSGGVVHALQTEEPDGEGACVQGRDPSLLLKLPVKGRLGGSVG